ncbi:hypothetical protein TSUD_97500 [Trifolium subterraneum]|uniref:Vacuolar fusion protein MON1 homolog n=1 Tax=Trifolium subterraneum TaxID=3900 RepID=A0A2Z6MDZ3_TRISU|nr:hypothetical protein TSUD_97500 [Trifolium subterraneum]
MESSSSSQSNKPEQVLEEERDIDIRTSTEPGSDNTTWIRTTGSDQDMDLPSSPSSSGYAGEGGGSTSATTGSLIEIEHDEIEEEQSRIQNQIDEISITDSNSSWIPGKRHQNEDDGSLSWRKRKKHFFILSNSGKPIYSRYGDEHKLAGFSATLQAIVSFVENGNPATFLHAYTCLPLSYATRQAAGAVLQDTADSGVLFATLMCRHKVISLVGAQKASLHPDDMLLLANFVMSSESFRQR